MDLRTINLKHATYFLLNSFSCSILQSSCPVLFLLLEHILCLEDRGTLMSCRQQLITFCCSCVSQNRSQDFRFSWNLKRESKYSFVRNLWLLEPYNYAQVCWFSLCRTYICIPHQLDSSTVQNIANNYGNQQDNLCEDLKTKILHRLRQSLIP